MTHTLTWFNDTLIQLSHRASNGTLPHALLIAGPKGIGKLEFSRLLAHTILGLKDSFHPDYSELSPEEDKKNISIDQVRSLIQQLSRTSHQGGYKIVVIYPAEAMNIAASNALLKTLEEPQGKTLVILCSHQPSRLLPTIISRCQRIKLTMPTRVEARGWLSQHCEDQELIEKALDITDNRPFSALEIIQNDNIKFYDDGFKHLSDVWKNKKNPIPIAEAWAKNDVEECINLMQMFVMQILKADGRVHRTFHLQDKITDAKRSLQTQSNPNKQLLLENLLMEFLWN